MKIILVIFVITSSFFLSACDQRKIITIGSGSANAMYHPVATSLCKIFNKYNDDKSIICEAKLSKGAEHNLQAVANGEFDMGMAQYNLYNDAYLGNDKFKNNAHKNLRLLMGLHYEYLTIIAKKNSNINSFADLKGKRVNIGNEGSGSRILFEQMLKIAGLTLDDFTAIYQESGSNINKVLCGQGKADAAVYIVGHPNKSFDLILRNCSTKLISLSKAEINNFIKLAPKYFKEGSIAKNAYKLQANKVDSFTSQTILFASAKLDKKIVKKFIKILQEHKGELVTIQPVLKSVDFSLFN